MLKKIIALLLTVLTVISLSACNESKDNTVDIPTVPEEEMVERTLDLSYITDEDPHHFYETDYAVSNGFESAQLNEDGTVTLVMTGKRYNQLLTDTATDIRNGVADIPNNPGYEHIREVTHNQELSEFTIYLDKNAYNAEEDFLSEYIASFGSLYQVLQGKPPAVSVTIIDIADNAVVAIMNFPEA